jgi:hypothetical protein
MSDSECEKDIAIVRSTTGRFWRKAAVRAFQRTSPVWRTIGHPDSLMMFGPNSLLLAENSLFPELISLMIRIGKCLKSGC